MGQFPDWAHRTMRALPPVKRLDCAFDMRDITDNSFAILQRFRAANGLLRGGDDFEHLSWIDRSRLLHDVSDAELLCVWTRKIKAFIVLDLDLLRLDLSNCRCLSGCCRLGKAVLENLRFDDTAAGYPRWIELIGALEGVEDRWRAAVRRGRDVPFERVFFVGAPGYNGNPEWDIVFADPVAAVA